MRYFVNESFALISLSAAVILFSSCKKEEQLEPWWNTGDEGEEVVEYYYNPVIQRSTPDPTCLRAQDGYYYLSGTEDTYNMPIWQSKDLVKWDLIGTVFNSSTRPEYVKAASLWAPEMRYIKGKYVMFYSMAKANVNDFSTTGYAVSSNPGGPYVHTGVIGNSAAYGIHDGIDEFIFEEDGKYYLTVGSYSAIVLFELDVANDLSYIKLKTETRQVLAGSWFEGNAVYKRGDYYYLFASIGYFGYGVGSDYETVVGRSKSLFGPYVNKSGGKMINNQYTSLIKGNSKFSNTGHCSEIVEDDNGDTWILYHGYMEASPSTGRCVFLDKLEWTKDGWPYVNDGTPSASAVAPYIK